MASWSVVFLIALAGITVSANPDPFTFPEDARERSASRIVSGWEAREGQLPFQLSVRMVSPVGAVSACGGTIIHSEWGLTAAHCTAGRITFVLRAGAVNLTRPEILFETSEFYNHPLYNNNLPAVVQPNDIGILKFGRSLTWSERVQPIRIARSVDQDRNYAGDRLVASGWGRTWTNGESPENLQWVYLSGVSNWACFLAYSGSNIIQDSTICASGYNVTSQSTCQGDSGGPLTVIDIDGGLSQVGISSFVSSTGCHTDFPAGFCRPAHYHDWYLEVTGINFDWDAAESSESSEQSSEQSSSSQESSQEPSSSEESPEVPESSEESPEVPEVPESSEESPEVPEVPESSEESPEAPEVPESSEESPEAPEVPESSEESPEVPEVPESSEESPEAPEVPESSEESPEAPEVPESSEESPEAPEVPESSEEVPEVTEVPETSEEVPESSEEVPEATEVPETSEEVPEVPEVPESPEEGDQGSEENFIARFMDRYWRRV